MENKATWGNERTLPERQRGAPVGLFSFPEKAGTKKYQVNILSIDEADLWCEKARRIVQEGDLIPRKVALERSSLAAEHILERVEIDKLLQIEQTIALYKLREEEIKEERQLDVLAEKLQKDYMRSMCDHLFDYDPQALPRAEIMELKPDYAMLVSAFMRLWRFTDPTSCLAAVVKELTK